MKCIFRMQHSIAVLLLLLPGLAAAQIHAMMNYETKSPESLKVLKNPVTTGPRKDGIAVVDVDPKSKTFGKIVEDLSLPADWMSHHIFYNKDQTKGYVTSLGKSEVGVIDLTKRPFKMKVVAVPDCQVGEDVVFSDDNKRWYLTCMGSQRVIAGDAVADKPTKTIMLQAKYPHGIAIHEGIDRMLTTSTVRPADSGDAGEVIEEIELSTGKSLKTYKVSNKKSPAGEAPVEILFAPKSNPPVAFVTNLFGGTLWMAKWNPAKKQFDVELAHDFSAQGMGVALEMYFNKAVDRMYVSTGKPGHMHIFDVKGANLTKPKLLKSIPAAEGAHHIAFTKDGRYAYVQNALLNLPGLSDGSITVVDMKSEKVIGSMDTLKNMGMNPNCIVLLPKWNDLAGH